MKKLLLAATLTVSLVSSVMAASPATKNFYLKASAGQASYEALETSDLDELGIDSSATSFGLGLGYRFSPQLAFEIEYVNLGGAVMEPMYYHDATITGGVEATTINAALAWNLNLSPNLYFQLRGGVAMVSAEVWAKAEMDGYSDMNISSEEDSTESLIGAGLFYKLNKNVDLAIDYTAYGDLVNNITFAVIYNY